MKRRYTDKYKQVGQLYRHNIKHTPLTRTYKTRGCTSNKVIYNNIMSDTNTSTSSGVSFLGLLTLLFIGLKLSNIIAWSWWWVTIPLWGVGALLITIFALATLAVWASRG